jgi:hypothetical protein
LIARPATTGGDRTVTEHIWETFNGLFKTAHAQARRIEEQGCRIQELETRVTELERRLRGVDAEPLPERPVLRVVEVGEMPTERAS